MKAFSGFFICCLHGSGELLCGKDEKNGGSSQNGRTDISGHIRTGAVVEAGTDLGAYKGTDAVADKDQTVVPVVELGTKHRFHDGRKHHQQTAKGKAHKADADDEIGQVLCNGQHTHGQTVEYQNKDQRIPALELIVDEAKADAAAHIGKGHNAHAHGSRHGRLTDLILCNGRGGADHHGASGICKDEHGQHHPEHRGLDHFRDVVVLGVEFLCLGCGGLPAFGDPALRAGDDHPCHSTHADEEDDGQNAAGHLCTVGADEPLSDRRHDEGTAGGARLHKAGDGAALIREPFQRSGQAGGVNGAGACTRHDTVEQVQLRNGRSKTGEEPACCEEGKAQIDGHAGLKLLGQQTTHKAHGAVDEHINGVRHAEVGAAPSELAGKRQGEQAEKGGGRGKQALDPDTCKHTPACHFGDLHRYSPLLLQRAEVQTQITAAELAGGAAGAQPVDHIRDVLHLKEGHTLS